MLTVAAAFVVGLAVGATTAAVRARRLREDHRRELEEARRRLAASRAARETFFDHATHELRSPLSAILGYQELLRDGVFGELSSEALDAVQRIGRSGRHLVDLIDGLAELGRLRAGDLDLDRAPVPLGPHLDGAAEAFHKRATERAIAPDITVLDPAPTVHTDAQRLARALDLLIVSALRHPAGERMRFRVSADQDAVRVTIGPVDAPGLSAEDHPAESLGIRLAVVQGTAEILGGGFGLEPMDDTGYALSLWIPAG